MDIETFSNILGWSGKELDTTDVGEDLVEATTTALVTAHPLQARLYDAARVVFNLLPAIVLVGLTGNALSLLVMVQKHNRHISCCVYMGALAVSDSIVLIIAGHYWMRTSGSFGHMSQWECKYICYFAMSVGPMGVMFIVCMTVERVLAVRYPLKSAIWCHYKRARKAVVAIVILLLLYSIPNILFAQIGFNGKFHDCYVYGVQSSLATLHSYTSTILNSLVPFTVILICNAVIIATLRRRNTYFRKSADEEVTVSGSGSPNQQVISSKAQSQERQLGRMLMLVSFALLMLTLPQYINLTFGIHSNPRLYYGTYALVGSVANRLYFLNNGINFFLYCIGGSKFREDLVAAVKALGPCCPCCRGCGQSAEAQQGMSGSVNTLSTGVGVSSAPSLNSIAG